MFFTLSHDTDPGDGMAIPKVMGIETEYGITVKNQPDFNPILSSLLLINSYETYRSLLDSPHWQRIFNAGARPQRLLWASTGTKDSTASDVLYIKSLAAPFTVNTMPESTLKAFGDHGEIGQTLSVHARYCDDVLAKFAKAGIDTDTLTTQLQDEGAKAFVKSWKDLMECIASKSEMLRKTD